MPTTADSVIVELEARNGTFSANVKRTDADFGAAMTSIERSATKAEAAVARSSTGIVKSAGQIANAQRNLGRQISDIGVGLASGQSPFLILAQQAPQVADALADTGGKAAGFAAVLSGPVGAAVLALGSILATTLLPRLLKSGDGVDDLVDKMKREAEQAGLNARATEIFAHTLDGLALSAKKAREEIEKTNRTELENLQLTYGQNQQRVIELTIQRTNAQKELNEALAYQSRLAAAYAAAPESQNTVAEQAATRRVSDARKQLALAQQGVEDAQVAATESRVPILDYQAAAADKATDATQRQEAAIRELRKAYDEAAEAANRLADPSKRQKALDDAAHTYRLGVEHVNKELEAAQESIRKAASDAKKTVAATTNFIRPVDGPITSGFGPRVAPTAGASTFHPGIDIAAPIGTPVRAAAGGVVISSGRLGGLGNVVIVDHGGGTITEYGHLSQLLASKGDKVSQGEVIGAVGNTGISTGPHLDYRVKVNGKAVDPRTGKFPTDQTAVELKAQSAGEREARDAERDRVQGIRNNESYENDKAELNAQIVAAMRAQAVTAEDIATFQRDEVTAATARKVLAINADEAAGKYTAQQANNLRVSAALGNALQILAINSNEQVEISKRNARVGASILDAQQAKLDATLALAGNDRDRRAIETQLLDLKYQEKKLLLDANLKQATINNDLDAQADAQRQLANLPDQQRADQHGIDLRYEGPLARYRRGLDDPQTQVEQAVADKLQAVDDAITDAAAKTLGIKDPFLRSLVQIFLEQNVLKPLYDSLSRAGSGGGGLGGLFGSLLGAAGSIFGGGGGLSSVSSSFGDFSPISAGNPVNVSTLLPGFASGGSMQIGGRAGIDQNILSLNDQPIARVGRGETLNVVPNARAIPGGAGNTTVIHAPQFNLRGAIITKELYADMQRISDDSAQRAGTAAYKQAVRDAPAAVSRTQRFGTRPS